MINIKKIISLLIVFISSEAYAQTSKSNIGIEAGPSVISIRGNDIVKKYNEGSIGYAVNLVFQQKINKTFSLHTGIGFERKGSKFPLTATDLAGTPIGTLHGYSRWNYLTVPVLLRATFGKKGNYFVNAGPYVGYLVKQVFGNKAGVVAAGHTSNIVNDRRFDFGASLGAGLSIPVKERIALSFEARDNLGLYNVSKVKVINDGTIKHNTTNFLFGFMYGINSGKKKK